MLFVVVGYHLVKYMNLMFLRSMSTRIPGIETDAVIVGTGLAGLTTALKVLEKGLSVVLVEKTDRLGGNSMKASSGINGTPTKYQTGKDSIESFIDDTIVSGKGLSNLDLVNVLCHNSKSAIEWLTEANNIDLSVVTKLGGHTHARTHRGSGKLPPGFAIMSLLIKRIQQYEKESKIKVLSGSLLHKILKNDGKVVGIEYLDSDKNTHSIISRNVVLATGGYSADFTSETSLLKKFRPDLVKFPSTNGQQTTGDGQKIAARDVNAHLVHMDQVQVHPTGFIKLTPETINDKWKFLCGELIRGIGGLLISPVTGERFTNELGRRDQVTNAINEHCLLENLSNDIGIDPLRAVSLIVVNKDDYEKAKNHIDFYKSQNLLQKGTMAEMVELLKRLNGKIDETKIFATLTTYNESVANNMDKYGRTHFGSVFNVESDFYFGLITPVVHFSMGGIEINKFGQVLNVNQEIVPNLFAVGEVSGGLHGGNRLGGSSLLECVVFGTVVSEQITLQ